MVLKQVKQMIMAQNNTNLLDDAIVDPTARTEKEELIKGINK